MSDSKDDLIEAQKQVIGILFEMVKRFQANSDLDEKYFQQLSEGRNNIDLGEILEKRKENAKIIGRLLEQLES